MNDEQPCNALGEPEEHIELRCCLPQGHEGPHSFVVFPHGVKGTLKEKAE